MLKVLYTVKTPVEGSKKTKEVDMVAKIFDEIAPKFFWSSFNLSLNLLNRRNKFLRFFYDTGIAI